MNLEPTSDLALLSGQEGNVKDEIVGEEMFEQVPFGCREKGASIPRRMKFVVLGVFSTEVCLTESEMGWNCFRADEFSISS